MRRVKAVTACRTVTPQAEAFDESGLDLARPAAGEESRLELVKRSEQGAALDADEAAPTIMFDELSVKEAGADLPIVFLATHGLNPVAEMGGECIKVQLQALAGEYRQTILRQHFHEGMHDHMCHRWSARPNFQHGDDFAAGVDGEPDP